MRVWQCTNSQECVVRSSAADAAIYSRRRTTPTALRPPPTTRRSRDDKAGGRVDANTRWGLLSAYYFIDDFNLDNPYPTAQSGASVPGFDALTTGRAQLVAFSATKAINATTVNEAHVSYLRDSTNLGQPVGGSGVSLVSQGFANANGTPSIVALDPKGQSVENLNFNGYSTGAAANQLIQANNTYQAIGHFFQGAGRSHDEVWR